MKLKKLLSLALCAVLLTSALPPVHVHAEDVAAASEIAEAEATPTPTPTPEPTEAPVEQSADVPTEQQANTLSVGPANPLPEEPTAEPMEAPTTDPTEEPTAEPTEAPTADPTEEPTADPTETPTADPTETPTADPTEEPTVESTEEPAADPTETPTEEPTETPVAEPSPSPEGSAEPEDGYVTLDLTQMDFLTADGLSAMMQIADVPMAIAAVPGPTIEVSGKKASGSTYYCPPVTVTVTAASGTRLEKVNDGVSDLEGVHGETTYTFSLKEANYSAPFTITATATSLNGDGWGESSRSVYVGHLATSTEITEVAPTCTEPGSRKTRQYCRICSATIKEETVGFEKLDHDYQPVQATCVGEALRVCSRCGDIEGKDDDESILNNEKHIWEPVVEEANCKRPYKTYQKCSQCGLVKEINQPDNKLGPHKLTGDPLKTVDPTCTETGYSLYKCEICQREDIKSNLKQPLGHDWTAWETVETEETSQCGKPRKEKRSCQRKNCGQTQERDGTIVPHNFTVTVVGEEATCTEDGFNYKKCANANCDEFRRDSSGQFYKEVVRATGHQFPGEREYDGTRHWYHCPKCGEEVGGSAHIFPANKDCTTAVKCQLCGYAKDGREAHDLEYTYVSGQSWHTETCKTPGCEYARTVAHQFTGDAKDCTAEQTCKLCGYTAKRYSSHARDFGNYVITPEGHSLRCAHEGCEVLYTQYPHSKETDDFDCTTPTKCAVCGYEIAPAQYSKHDFGAIDHGNIEQGVRKCKHPGCNVEDKTTHTLKTTRTEIKKATCLEDGLNRVFSECTGCGATFESEEVVKAKGYHEWGKWTESGTSCSGGVLQQRTCTVCGTVETKDLIVSDHDWKTQETKEANCTEGGTILQVCSECGAEQTVKDPEHPEPLGHDWTDKKTTPANCQHGEITVQTCSRCGVTETFEAAEKAAHVVPNAVYNDDATCTTDGTQKGECSKCHVVVTIPAPGTALDHTFLSDGDCTTPDKCIRCETYNEAKESHALDGEWRIDSVDGVHYKLCTNTGCEQRVIEEAHTPEPDDGNCTTPVTCSKCGAVVVSAADAHSLSAWFSDGDAQHKRTCLNSGCLYSESRDHEYVLTGSVTVEGATCTKDGKTVNTYLCGVCDDEKIEEVAVKATGHDFSPWVNVQTPDCDNAGLQERGCYKCGEVETNNLNPLGHPWEENFQIDIEPTCTRDGSKSIHCTRCEARKDSTVIPALPHSYEHGKELSPATCTSPAFEVAVCSMCGYKITRENPEKPALGHSFNTYVSAGDATCLTDGHETAKCERCDATDTRVAPGSAIGHTPDASVKPVVTAATCLAGGYTTYTCARCGEKYAADYTSATGHTPVRSSGYGPTCTSEGMSDGEVCAVCGAVLGGFGSIPALGHDVAYSGGYPATCTSPGLGSLAYCRRCGATISGYYEIPPLGHAFGGWTSDGGGTHSASCGRCGERRTEGCAYGEIDVGGTLVRVCRVCGDVLDPTGGEAAKASVFTPIAGATGAEIDPGAIPVGTELIVRKLDLPFAEDVKALEAFTVAYELDGVALPLLGRVEVRIPLMLDVTAPFRLVRVDVTPETATTPRSEVWVALDYDYTDGVLTFVTDRDGLFLLVPLDAILR